MERTDRTKKIYEIKKTNVTRASNETAMLITKRARLMNNNQWKTERVGLVSHNNIKSGKQQETRKFFNGRLMTCAINFVIGLESLNQGAGN